MKTSLAAVLLWALCAPAGAQWVHVPPANVPRTPDGKPDLSAPAPQVNGHPDLSGVWNPNPRFLRDIAADLKADNVPLQPWAKALFERRADGSQAAMEPDANCLPQGVPKIDTAPAPWKLVQTPNLIVVVYEAFNLWRQIFLDGRDFAPDLNPTWMGYSTGKWEDGALVVESRGFNGKAWLDQLGRPTTDALHVTERFRRKDFGHLDVQVTIDDPKAYTRPWTVTYNAALLPEGELMEFICNENNRDIPHLPAK
ncbi:MAG TPA: hypothetical protein VKV74_13180 [Bryobacteraceae bacterium]|nr:hypothetical protein [Bryobacteraceae bacterium]